MSNLITTAQETFRKQCVEAYLGLQSLAERAREQRGQTAAEYMGILFIISAIIVAIMTTHLDTTIGNRVSAIVTAIGNGVKP